MCVRGDFRPSLDRGRLQAVDHSHDRSDVFDAGSGTHPASGSAGSDRGETLDTCRADLIEQLLRHGDHHGYRVRKQSSAECQLGHQLWPIHRSGPNQRHARDHCGGDIRCHRNFDSGYLEAGACHDQRDGQLPESWSASAPWSARRHGTGGFPSVGLVFGGESFLDVDAILQLERLSDRAKRGCEWRMGAS